MKKKFKIFLFSLKPEPLIYVVVSGVALFVLCVILAFIVAPEMISSDDEVFERCSDVQTFNCISNQSEQEFLVIVSDVKKENNYLRFKIVPYIDADSDNIGVNLTLVIRNSDEDEVKSFNGVKKFEDGKDVISHFISYARDNEYTLRLKIFDEISNVQKLKFEVTFINSDFFKFVLGIKYFFFAYMLSVIAYFFYKTHRIKFRYMHFQTISSLVMCFSVLIFNEPLIGAYTTNALFGISATAISIFCNVQFICVLIIFWLLMLQELNNPYCKNIIKLFEFIFICSLFSFLFVIYIYVESNLKYNPKYDWETDLEKTWRIIYIVLITVITLFAVWMIVLILMSIRLWGNENFTTKKKIYWGFNYAIIVISFLFIGLGYIQVMQYSEILFSVIALYNIYFSILLFVSIPDYTSYKKWVDKLSQNDSSFELN